MVQEDAMTRTDFVLSGIRFGNLEAWPWVVLALLLGAGIIFSLGRYSSRLDSMVNIKNIPLLVHDFSLRQKWAFNLCFILALFFSSLALMEPKWGFHWEEIQRKGVDLMIAVDVSKSMLAQDLSPSRLVGAKRKILDLLELIEGDRIGLIAFAGTSYLQCPLTLDYGAFRMFLELLDTDLIPQQGTALDDAIRLSMDSFSEESRKSRALIIITDGEEHSGAYLEAAREAAKNGIRIYTLGMGSVQGHPIPDPANQGRNLKDAKGGIVISRLNEKILQEIALETQGVYVRAQTSDDDLKKIYIDEIRTQVESRNLKSTRQKRFESRFQIFLALALLFLVLDSFLRSVPWKLQNASRSLPLLLLILFGTCDLEARAFREWFGFPSPAEEQVLKGRKSYTEGDFTAAISSFGDAEIDLPSNLQNTYNLGNSYFQNGDYTRAKETFEKVLSQPAMAQAALAQNARYNLGNTEVRLGNLEGAIKAYEEVLMRDENHGPAKTNLEWARRKLKELLNKQKKSGDKNKQNHGQKKDQKKGEDQQQQEGNDKNQPQSSPGAQEKQEKQDKQEQNPSQDEKKEGEKDGDKAKEPGAQKTPPKPGKDKLKKPTEGQGKDAKSGESQEVGRLSKEEAQRFLNRLSRENKDQLKRFIRYKLQGKGKGKSRGKQW
jgi:Ca-activated chloride channel homolog